MGIPEMKNFWEDLCKRAENNTFGNNRILFKQIIKCLNLLRTNPRHNSLATQEVKALSQRYSRKIWQSYLENRTPSAGRFFWTYGPARHQITILGIEPHPEDKKSAGYKKVKLSDLPDRKLSFFLPE